MNFIALKILKICFSGWLYGIFGSKKKVNNLFYNFSISFRSLSSLLRVIILFYLIVLLILDFLFIILYFYKLQINYINHCRNFVCKIKFFKNTDNYIMANLLMHCE